MENKREIGSKKEELAAAYLMDKGLNVLRKNYYFPGGEIDLVVKDEEYLVFTEVKYRRSASFGFPAEAVNKSKQKKMILGARMYLHEYRLPMETPCRFDVISICGDEITWMENAFCLT